MTTFDDLPRDIQLRIFREALFDDYDAFPGPGGTWPESLNVPELPIPVEPVTWDDDQVLFDPVPPGVTEGLRAAKAAGRISTVSRSFMSLARDDSMWQAVLYAAEVACEFEDEDEENPVREPPSFEIIGNKGKGSKGKLLVAELSKKYSLPRLANKGWLTLSPFDRCRKMLTFIEMVYEDFYEQCHDYNQCVGFASRFLTLLAEHILDPEVGFMRHEMVRRTDKELGNVTLFNNDSDQTGEGFEVFEGFTPPAVGRMLWNAFAEDGMTQGSIGLREFWEILSGGPMNCGVGNSSTRDCFEDVVLNELIIQGFIEHDPVLMRKGGKTEAEIKEACGDTYE